MEVWLIIVMLYLKTLWSWEVLLKSTLKMQMLLEPVEKKQSKSLNNALFQFSFAVAFGLIQVNF